MEEKTKKQIAKPKTKSSNLKGRKNKNSKQINKIIPSLIQVSEIQPESLNETFTETMDKMEKELEVEMEAKTKNFEEKTQYNTEDAKSETKTIINLEKNILKSYASWSHFYSIALVIFGIISMVSGFLGMYNSLSVLYSVPSLFIFSALSNFVFGIIAGIVLIGIGINLRKSSHFAILASKNTEEKETENNYIIITFKYLRDFFKFSVLAGIAGFLLVVLFTSLFVMVLINVPNHFKLVNPAGTSTSSSITPSSSFSESSKTNNSAESKNTVSSSVNTTKPVISENIAPKENNPAPEAISGNGNEVG